MGVLIEGKWHDRGYETKDGRFVRDKSVFKDRVAADGSTRFRPEANRYHLYVSYACPWASRTLVIRKLKKLEDVIGLSVVHPLMLENGWTLDECDGCIPDTVNGKKYLYEIYLLAKADYSGRVTVPVLWDKKERTIVNNNSADIIRMLNSEFNALSGEPELDFYPEILRPEIDEVNELVYPNVNDGVYRCGFAGTQAAYEEAFDNLFRTFDELDARLARQRYLCGDRITEADWRLFTTLVRFDPVYHVHFKCNLRRLVDYPNLWGYTRDLYQVPGVAETVNLDHIKQHYYMSHRHINPTGIVPKGPDIDYAMPHDRAHAWA